MALGNVTNNPGNLLSNSGNWLGLLPQSKSGNGLTYDQFQSVPYGVRALAIDLRTAISNGATTLTALVAHYLGNPVKNGVIAPTKANPHPQQYLQNVESKTGFGPNSKLSPSDAGTLAKGFIFAEGSTVSEADYQKGISMAGLTGAQGSLTAAAGSVVQDFNTGVQSVITNPFGSAQILAGTFGAGVQGLSTDLPGSLNYLGDSFNRGASTTAQAAADTTGQAIKSAGDGITGALSGFQGLLSNIFSGSNLERGVLIVVGVMLLAAALFALSRNYAPAAAGRVAALTAA